MILTALLALGLAQPAAAETGLVVPPHRWIVDYSRMSCTLARRLSEEGSAIVAFNAPLGREPGELLVMDGGGGIDRRLNGELQVRLDDGPPLVLHARGEERNARPVVSFFPVPDAFLGRIAGAHQLAVSKDNEVVLLLAMPGAHDAVDALARCNEDLLQSWGIDMNARRALRREPRLRTPDWASDIHPAANTSLAFAAEVSETGMPLDCRIVVSSLNERMDDAVCRLIRSRARFTPALDASGRPVHAQYVTRIRWINPPD